MRTQQRSRGGRAGDGACVTGGYLREEKGRGAVRPDCVVAPCSAVQLESKKVSVIGAHTGVGFMGGPQRSLRCNAACM